MRNLSGLAARVRKFLFGAPDGTLVENENRGGDNVVPLDSVREESPSKENASPDEGLLACSEIEKDKQEEDSAMMNRFPWDIYEAVMLLEAYLEIEKYPQRRSVILKRLSADLRGRAEKKGMKIDATFRNVNGMNLQYERFRYMMTGGKRGFQGPIPKCFIEAKALYEKDRPAYMKILKDAMPKEKQEVRAPSASLKEEVNPVEGIATISEVAKEIEYLKETKSDTEKMKDSVPPVPRLLWDWWEWALLLEAYEEIEKAPERKSPILQQLSNNLRQRAINKGFVINETFRNLNGINLHYERIRYFMTNGKHGFAGTEIKGFKKVQDIYYNDKNWFGLILRQGKREAGIDVPRANRKSSPITVVDGVVVQPSEPTIQILPQNRGISLRGVPTMYLVRDVFALQLSLDLQRKLYNQKIHTMKELAAYLNQGKEIDLSSSELSEVYSRLKTYLDEHRSGARVDYFSSLETGKNDMPKENKINSPNPVAPAMSSSIKKIGGSFLAPELLQGELFAEPPAVYGKNTSVRNHEAKMGSQQLTKEKPTVQRLVKVTLSLREAKKMAEKGVPPMGFSLQGRKFSVQGWESCYTKALSYLCSKYVGIFKSLRAKSMYAEKDFFLVDRGYSRKRSHIAKISYDFYVKTDLSPVEMLTYIKKVLSACQIKGDAFSLDFYKKKAKERAASLGGGEAPSVNALATKSPEPSSETEKDASLLETAADPLAEQLLHILTDRFTNGFVPNRLGAKKFRSAYEEVYGVTFPLDLEILIEKLKRIGEERGDGRIYAKVAGSAAAALKAVAHALEDLFRGGASMVYAESFRERYGENFALSAIFTTEDMIKALWKYLPRDLYYCDRGVYRTFKNGLNDGEEVLDFVKSSYLPITEEEVANRFWYIPQTVVDKMLKRNSKILHLKKTWFYYPNFPLPEEEKDPLREKLQETIWDKVYVSDDDILQLLKKHFPGLAADVSSFPKGLVRYSLALLLGFSTSRGTLTNTANHISPTDALRNFCRSHERLTKEALSVYRGKIGFKGNYASTVMEEMVRISEEEWMRRDLIHFDPRISQCLGKAMQGKECIPIQEITSFQEYPEIGVKWNSCVLESYLFKDKDFCKFCLLQAGGQVSSWGAYGVIAKKGSIAVKDYKSAVIYLLARSHDWNDVDGALECIISMGLQATRKMKDIEEIVKVARAERARITPWFRGKACMRK